MLLGGSWHPASPWLGLNSAVSASTSTPRPGHHQLTPHGAAPLPQVSFDFPRADLPQAPDVASLAIPGRNGDYLVPYIQTQPDLHFRVRAQDLPASATVVVYLDAGTSTAQAVAAIAPTFAGDFHNVPMGDHRLAALVYRGPVRINRRGTVIHGAEMASAQLNHVARGDIIAALGDSTTEGNGGARFPFIQNWVSALASAADWTSPDGRNFPQAGAFAHPEAPASFTSTLGTILEQQRHHPVLVLNDGWSGATT